MRGKKRFSLKLVVSGFAVAAIAAPAGQARPDPEPTGPELLALHQVIVAKSVRTVSRAKTTQPVRVIPRHIREYEPGE